MKLPANDPTPAKEQPMQFGLARLLQFVTVAALWWGAVIVRDNVVLGMAFVLLTVDRNSIARRFVMNASRKSRWSRKLSERVAPASEYTLVNELEPTVDTPSVGRS